ncbi:hypothetical protein LINPERHAP2_LOCUS28680 [Linum perenne]
MAAAFQPSQSSGVYHTAAAVHTQKFEVPVQTPTAVVRSPAHQVAAVSNDDAAKHGKTIAQSSFDPTGPSSSGISQFVDDWYS